MDTIKHIENLQAAAIDLEDRMRKSGLYAADCQSLDELRRRSRKSGVALLWGQDGKLEIVDLNGGAERVHVTDEGKHVAIEHDFPTWNNPGREEKHRDETDKLVEEGAEAYESMAGETFQKAAAKSHTREKETKGRFEPQSHTTDTARIARELKAKQTADAARGQSYRADAIARNERIFAAQRARSAEIHR